MRHTPLPFPSLTLRPLQLFSNDPNATILETVDAENFPINLQLTSNGWLSRVFGGMSYELFKEVGHGAHCVHTGDLGD